MKTITIFGASGRQGLAQVRVALQAGHQVRAITRNASVFPIQQQSKLQVMTADYKDSESLQNVCEDADAVFLTPPSFTDLMSNAARMETIASIAYKAGVQRLILNTSMYVPDEPIGESIYDGRLALENAIEATGISLTVFRPVLFMDNLLTDWVRPSLATDNLFVYPHNPKMRANWICLEDVAEFMVRSLDDESLIGERMVIGGPETLTPPQVAQKLGEVLGRTISYHQSSYLEFAQDLNRIFSDVIDVPDDVQIKMIADFYKFNNETDMQPMAVDMKPVLDRIPISLTSLEDWVKQQDWSVRDSNEPAPIGG